MWCHKILVNKFNPTKKVAHRKNEIHLNIGQLRPSFKITLKKLIAFLLGII